MKLNNTKLDLMLARRCMILSELRSITSGQTLTRIRQRDKIKPSTLGLIAWQLGCNPAEIIEEVN